MLKLTASQTYQVQQSDDVIHVSNDAAVHLRLPVPGSRGQVVTVIDVSGGSQIGVYDGGPINVLLGNYETARFTWDWLSQQWDAGALPQSYLGYAPNHSPGLTGVPRSPNPALADNSTQIATTAFVQALVFATLGGVPEAPPDSQLYGRDGLAAVWRPTVPTAGGVTMTGLLVASGPAVTGLGLATAGYVDNLDNGAY